MDGLPRGQKYPPRGLFDILLEERPYDLKGRPPEVEKEPPPAIEISPITDFPKPLPRNDLLEGGWLPRDCVTLVSGHGGAGKSSVIMALGLAVASGQDENGFESSSPWTWLDHEHHDPGQPRVRLKGRVVYLSWEDTRDDIYRIAWAVRNKRDWSDFHAEHLTKPLYSDSGPTPYGRTVAKLLAELNPLLLVIDPVSHAFSGNENIRPQVASFIQWAAGLAQHVLIVGHPPKTGLPYSGSTAWESSSRAVWILKRAASNLDPSWHCEDSTCRTCHYNGRPRQKGKTLHDPCPHSPAASHDPDDSIIEHWTWTLAKANHGPRGSSFSTGLRREQGRRPTPIEIPQPTSP